jgi:hypothetical protein
MGKKQDTKSFSTLVLTQLLSSVCQRYCQGKTDQDSALWLNQSDPTRYPFFDVIQVIEEEKGLFKKLGHLSFLQSDNYKTFFISQEKQWIELFDVFNSKGWHKASQSIHLCINYVYTIELNGFKTTIRERFDNVLGRMPAHDIETYRSWIDPLLKRPTLENIDKAAHQAHKALASLSEELILLSRLDKPDFRIEKIHEQLTLLLELCQHVSPLFTASTVLKFTAIYLLKQTETYPHFEASQHERCEQLYQQYRGELNAKSGFIFDCQVQLEHHAHLKDFKEKLGRISSAYHAECVSFIQALHLRPNPHTLTGLFQHLLESVEWPPLLDYLGRDFAIRLHLIRKEIDTQQLPATALSEDDLTHFTRHIQQSFTYFTWTFALLSYHIKKEAFTPIALFITACLNQLREQQGSQEAAVFLQSLLLMTTSDSRFHLFHEILLHTHKENSRSMRKFLGLATHIYSPEPLSSLDMTTAWAIESKQRLLSINDVWWSLLFADIDVQEISQSPLFIGLLDFYHSHAREKELIHHFIRSLEAKKEQSEDHASDASLLLSALSIQLKRRRFDCPLVQDYAVTVTVSKRRFLKSCHTLTILTKVKTRLIIGVG